jgi:antitoxin ParD1/3/4
MATKNTSVVLTDHFARFAEQQVRDGRYGSTSEVLRAGLRLLEEREAKIASLKSALAQGDTSGVDENFDFDAFIDAFDDSSA